MQTDPIADMLTRIRNAVANRDASVDVPASKFKAALAAARRRGLPQVGRETDKDGKSPCASAQVRPQASPVIHYIQRVSTPGRRAYAKARTCPWCGGLG